MANIDWYSFAIASWQTVYMVFISSFISIVGGMIIGVILYLTQTDGLKPQLIVHQILGFIVNIGRSVPYIILMIAVIPLTRLIVGTTIGTNAAIVSLSLAALPFYGRIAEAALSELPAGLIDASLSMGAMTWQTIYKVCIPESLPSLIKGGTLTIIALISYSAMAGAIGGGGLGQLAIDYGYQQFNIPVMITTVILLVVLVQLIQLLGNRLAHKPSLKWLGIVCIILWSSCFASQWHWGATTTSEHQLKVGIMTGVQQRIMAVAQRVALRHYGLHLKLIAFNDYNTPNEALVSHEIAANIFQHVPFLDSQIKQHNYKIVPIARTFVYPMGVFSKKIYSVSQLKPGDLIAIPNDPSNEGRALRLIAKQGLITLKHGVGIMGTVHDITQNPDHLKFILMNAAQIPRALNDVTLAAINNTFLKPAGLKLSDALFHEGSNAPYGNIIAARKGDRNPLFKQLIAVMHSKPVIRATEAAYPHGAAIPAWEWAH